MAEPIKNILLTCGVGDFLALICYMTEKERKSVETIYYATRARKLVQQLTPFVFPSLKEEIVIFEDFTTQDQINSDPLNPVLLKNFCIRNIEELKEKKVESIPEDIADFSIEPLMKEISSGRRKFRRPDELISTPLSGRMVPGKKYCVIHPWSENQKQETRDLNFVECQKLSNFIQDQGMVGIVVNQSGFYFPIEAPHIIDFTNELSFLQVLELVKSASMFAGCASFPSVMASKVLPMSEVFIKGNEAIRIYNWKFYYQPYPNNSFMHENFLWM